MTRPEVFRDCAEKGIELAAEPDTVVLTPTAPGSIFSNYNAIMDQAAAMPELEALVLVHQDAEIQDPDFCVKLRTALADPEVGVVGCVGSLGVRSIAWWEGSVTWASFIHRYTELGGGDFPSLTWNETDKPPYAQLGEVDTVDGFVLALSPWVVRNVRFDENLGQLLHGYDFDFCLQVRERGRKVVTADFKVIHNHSLELASDLDHWSEAHVAVAEKWDGRMPGVGVSGGSWKRRALRSEAEAAVTRAVAYSTQMKIDAQAAEYRRELALMTDSLAWKLTAPLRSVTAFQRRRAAPTRSFDTGGRRVRRVPTVLGRRLSSGDRSRRRSR
ncbi:MAG: glycosyltransferase [Solirubrobacteraceae bacterium]